MAIVEVLNEVCEKSNIKIKLIDSSNNEVFNNLPATESKVMRKISVKDKKYKIVLDQDDIKTIPIIEYLLDKCANDVNVIEELIEGKKQWGCLSNLPIVKSNKMLLIETDKENEVLEIVRDMYLDSNIYIGEVYNRIIIIGNLEDEKEHALSLKETIIQTLGINAKISINDLDYTFEGFKNSYNDSIKALDIGNKFKISPEIYFSKEMYLEKAIFNLSNEYVEGLNNQYKDILKNLSHEVIQTIEEILKCDLSLTKASKKLYVHRNTLMYRIEKIKKETGFDIRNFKEAAFLYILYLNNKTCK